MACSRTRQARHTAMSSLGCCGRRKGSSSCLPRAIQCWCFHTTTRKRVGMRRTWPPEVTTSSFSYYLSHSHRPFEKTGNCIAPNIGRGKTSDAHCYGKRSRNMIAAWPSRHTVGCGGYHGGKLPSANHSHTRLCTATPAARKCEGIAAAAYAVRQQARPEVKHPPWTWTMASSAAVPALRQKSAGRSNRLFPCPSRNGPEQIPVQSHQKHRHP